MGQFETRSVAVPANAVVISVKTVFKRTQSVMESMDCSSFTRVIDVNKEKFAQTFVVFLEIWKYLRYHSYIDIISRVKNHVNFSKIFYN